MWPFKKKKLKEKKIEDIDWIFNAYLSVIISFFMYIIGSYYLGKEAGITLLILIPVFVAVIGFLAVIPMKVLHTVILEVFYYFYLKKFPINKNAQTVVVLANNDYNNSKFWLIPNYGLELIFLLKYLKVLGVDFSIHKNINENDFVKIIENKDIKDLYLVGHGRRHGFALEPNKVIDYCKFQDKKVHKDHVYQLHCNHLFGKSLVEYIVPEENWNKCMPDYQYNSNINIMSVYIKKTLDINTKNKIHRFFTWLYYQIIFYWPVLLFAWWLYFLFKYLIFNTNYL